MYSPHALHVLVFNTVTNINSHTFRRGAGTPGSGPESIPTPLSWAVKSCAATARPLFTFWLRLPQHG